jgi:hypothetical protein
MVRQYSEALRLYNIRTSPGIVDVLVISPLEIIENIVKFNWSKIARSILHVEKRKAELIEPRGTPEKRPMRDTSKPANENRQDKVVITQGRTSRQRKTRQAR